MMANASVTQGIAGAMGDSWSLEIKENLLSPSPKNMLKYFLRVRFCAKCFAYVPNSILTTAKRDICISTYQMKKLRL